MSGQEGKKCKVGVKVCKGVWIRLYTLFLLLPFILITLYGLGLLMFNLFFIP